MHNLDNRKWVSKVKMVSILTMVGLGLTGCGGGSPSSDTEIDVAASADVNPPTQILEDNTGVLQFEVHNDSGSRMLQNGLGSSCPSVNVVDMQDQTTKTQGATLANANAGQVVGAGKACWNDSEGATLACGETCYQSYNSAPDAESCIGLQ